MPLKQEYLLPAEVKRLIKALEEIIEKNQTGVTILCRLEGFNGLVGKRTIHYGSKENLQRAFIILKRQMEMDFKHNNKRPIFKRGLLEKQ